MPCCVLQLRVEQRSEWDEAAYLQRHSEAAAAIEAQKVVDGLHHFMSAGFANNLSSCWNDTRVQGGRQYCIE